MVATNTCEREQIPSGEVKFSGNKKKEKTLGLKKSCEKTSSSKRRAKGSAKIQDAGMGGQFQRAPVRDS